MRALGGILIASMLIASTPARADDLADAQAHLDRGVIAFRASDYHLAHDEFAAAQALAPDHANPYRWLALTEVQLGDCPDALGHIDAFVARVAANDSRLAEMVRLRGMCERVTATPPPPPRRHHRSRKWWWIGGATATAAILTGILVIAAGGDDVTALPPVHCGDAGCTP